MCAWTLGIHTLCRTNKPARLILLAGLFGCALMAAPCVYATNSLGNAIAVIDSNSYSLVANVVTGYLAYPGQVALSPDGAYVYATNQGNNTLSIMSTAGNTVIRTLNVGSTPYGVAVTPDGAFVYVANQTSNNVSVIGTGAQRVAATIPVAAGPFSVAMSPDGLQVWVAGTASNQISVISTTTNTVVSTLQTGADPVAMTFSPDGARVYVAEEFANQIAVYDAASRLLIATIPVPGAPNALALSPDGQRLYVTSADNATLRVIAVSTNRIVSNWPVGTLPDGVAISADGTSAWVSNSHDSSLSVIDTGHGAILATIYGLAFYPQGLVISGTPSPAPSLDPNAFVTQLYSDLLNRAPDSSGLSYWAGQLNSGALSFAQVAQQFFASPEFYDSGRLVAKDYIAVLARDPDFAGWFHWLSEVQSGAMTTDQMLTQFLGSPEFNATYGNLDNQGFVNLVYQNVLQRPADAAGLAYWTGQLDTGEMSREQVMNQFIGGSEFDALVTNRALANLLYMGFLRRSADAAGLAYWEGQLAAGLPQLSAINAFISSPEYLARF